MTEGEAKKLETEVVIFPVNFKSEGQTIPAIEENSKPVAGDRLPTETSIQTRFARLKKSLRKRSVSIL